MGTGLLKCPVSVIMCTLHALKVSANSSFAAAWLFPGLLVAVTWPGKGEL